MGASFTYDSLSNKSYANESYSEKKKPKNVN